MAQLIKIILSWLHLFCYSMENHKQWKNEFDLKTNSERNNLIFVPISTGKEKPGKAWKKRKNKAFSKLFSFPLFSHVFFGSECNGQNIQTERQNGEERAKTCNPVVLESKISFGREQN
jgi:hypothetical protein